MIVYWEGCDVQHSRSALTYHVIFSCWDKGKSQKDWFCGGRYPPDETGLEHPPKCYWVSHYAWRVAYIDIYGIFLSFLSKMPKFEIFRRHYSPTIQGLKGQVMGLHRSASLGLIVAVWRCGWLRAS